MNNNFHYEFFINKLLNLNWQFLDSFYRCLLLPDIYEQLFIELEFLQNNNFVDVHDGKIFHSILNLGRKRYLEYLIDKENLPRKEAQKFIGKKEVRLFIFNRDGNKCLCCGNVNNLSIDHIKSVYFGGNNDLENLQTLCTSCNSSKGKRYIDYRKNNNYGEYTLV